MKKLTSVREKHIAKIIIFFVGVTGICSQLSNALLPTPYAPILTAVAVLLAMAITWFGKEFLFQKILLKVPAVNPKYKLSVGTWNIHITFDDGGGKALEERSGSVTMTSSLLGVKIFGGKLLNVKNNRTTMNGWYAENAELVTYDNHDILYYLYKIPIDNTTNGDDEMKFEKIGFVCASRVKGTDLFEGYFRDIRIKAGMNNVREGKIRLVFNG
ncbi:MAG: hypothetical protein PHP95_13395 [Desulfuromonadaceae bacterium]|nr:hypothetical protein [Desulfuromonadaceae bacterium]MDD2849441.1 hypothetical protein [Desulfuromonadaceae bacterium]MDD4130545.1 hypothetical protein [Desulfuromonadaceae bacterium]